MWGEFIPLKISVHGTNAQEVEEVTLALIEHTKLLLRPRSSTPSVLDKSDVEAKLSLLHVVKVVFCYAHQDEALLNKLKAHLRPLQRQGLIDVWYDRNINAGGEWKQEISGHLNTAQIILLLVSPDFMDSDYCYGIEMKQALERHERGEARVIPIILRPVLWQKTPIGKLQALPTNAKPITDPYWITQDRGFHNVAEGINKVIE